MKTKENIEEIALDILKGKSYTDIANKFNISTKTIYRLRQSENFQKILTSQKKRIFETVLSKASYLSNLALDELKNIISESSSNAQSKIQACKIILELAKNDYEFENIEQRIEQLEKLAKAN